MTLPAGDAARTVAPASRRRRRTGLWSTAYMSHMAAPLTESALVVLALEAQQRNLTLGVTGALFLSGDRFLQVLEGERRPVSWLYDRIAADPRHHRVVCVLDQPIDTRAFVGWSMRIMDEHDLPPDRRRIVIDSLDRAEQLGEAGRRFRPAEFAHCYAALAGSAPRPTAEDAGRRL